MTDWIPAGDLAALARLDTCAVANAIETFGRRLRNEGFTNSSIRCLTPECAPVVGYAETLKVRSSSPPPEWKPETARAESSRAYETVRLSGRSACPSSRPGTAAS